MLFGRATFSLLVVGAIADHPRVPDYYLEEEDRSCSEYWMYKGKQCGEVIWINDWSDNLKKNWNGPYEFSDGTVMRIGDWCRYSHFPASNTELDDVDWWYWCGPNILNGDYNTYYAVDG